MKKNKINELIGYVCPNCGEVYENYYDAMNCCNSDLNYWCKYRNIETGIEFII
jgi:hypothetical protein